MGHWEWGMGHGALGMGHGALGMGHWALGIGHGALGMGHWALIFIDFLQLLWLQGGLVGPNLSISRCFFKNKC
jgi:hypothetical protein